MHTINHYTLNTGNLRVSYPEEVNKDLFFFLKKYINRAKRGKTQLLDGTYMYIIEEEDCYVCTLYGKRGNDFVPIISTSGTKDESARTYVWEQMEHMAKAESQGDYTTRVPVTVPYIVDYVHITSVYFFDALTWTGDFARCLGWMMLFPEEVREKL